MVLGIAKKILLPGGIFIGSSAMAGQVLVLNSQFDRPGCRLNDEDRDEDFRQLSEKAKEKLECSQVTMLNSETKWETHLCSSVVEGFVTHFFKASYYCTYQSSMKKIVAIGASVFDSNNAETSIAAADLDARAYARRWCAVDLTGASYGRKVFVESGAVRVEVTVDCDIY